MTPKPYSEKSSLPTDSSSDTMAGITTEILPQTPSPLSLSGATTPSPTLQEQVPVEPFVDNVNIRECNRMPDLGVVTPCYPTPGDIMPYDHSLPDFIRQITNQPNLANLQSLSLRVISTLISLHRMSAYLPNLRELDLEGSVLNSLRDIGCSLKNLQILKVGRCQLESLDGTFGLSSLRELYAQRNFINDVSPCSNLPHIRHIDVSGNRIRNISYAGFLSVCSKLRSIVFTGNPATEVSDYRNHVRRILPQVETLDGVPFGNGDSAEEFAEAELIESYVEESDSSSTEVPDASAMSPSNSISNLFKSDELSLLDKKNKQAKNLANQDQSDAGDCVAQEVSNEMKTNLQFQDELQNRNLHQNQERKGFPGQAKNSDNRNVNLKQKCTSIQKLDKDIENRSKKSNLLLNGNFGEELVPPTEFSTSQNFEGESTCSSGSSTSAAKNGDLKKLQLLNEEAEKRPTIGSASSFSTAVKEEEIKYGVIKKRPATEVPKSKDEEQVSDQNWGLNKLTSGLPVCGNLTAALRNRKKIQNAWAGKQNYLNRKIQSQSDAHECRKLEVQGYGSGDDLDVECAESEGHSMTGEDVVATSGKWGESFLPIISNNRTSWEEGGDEDEKEEFDLDHQNEK